MRDHVAQSVQKKNHEMRIGEEMTLYAVINLHKDQQMKKNENADDENGQDQAEVRGKTIDHKEDLEEMITHESLKEGTTDRVKDDQMIAER